MLKKMVRKLIRRLPVPLRYLVVRKLAGPHSCDKESYSEAYWIDENGDVGWWCYSCGSMWQWP